MTFYGEGLIDSLFGGPRTPNEEQVRQLEAMRKEFRALAESIAAFTPEGPARTIALRKLHEASMAAVYALVGGK